MCLVVLYYSKLTPHSRVLPENLNLHQLQKFHAIEQFPFLPLLLTPPQAQCIGLKDLMIV